MNESKKEYIKKYVKNSNLSQEVRDYILSLIDFAHYPEVRDSILQVLDLEEKATKMELDRLKEEKKKIIETDLFGYNKNQGIIPPQKQQMIDQANTTVQQGMSQQTQSPNNQTIQQQ